jgi:hypothetical protein
MDKSVLSRFVAPAVLAVGTLLASSPAFAGGTTAMMAKTPLPTAASERLAGTASHMRSDERFGFRRTHQSSGATSHASSSHTSFATHSTARARR